MSHTANQPPQTLDQRRANHAWDVIQKVKPRSDAKKFGGQAKKLPTRIMTAGLGQALAFLEAKKSAPDKKYASELLTELSEWMKHRLPPKQGEPKELLVRIVKGNSEFLRRATDEVIAYLLWLNRFAEAEGLAETEDEGET